MLFISLGLIGCENKIDDNNPLPNTPPVNIKDQTIGDIKITDFKIEKDNNMNKITFYAENLTSTDYSFEAIKISFYDSSNNFITGASGYFGDVLGPWEREQIVTAVTNDLTSLYRVEYEVVH